MFNAEQLLDARHGVHGFYTHDTVSLSQHYCVLDLQIGVLWEDDEAEGG